MLRRLRHPARSVLPALAAPVIVLALACGSASVPSSTPTPTLAEPASRGIEPILATTVLRVGTQRVAFLLASEEALIQAPEATVQSTFLGARDASGETRQATFRLWPYGVRGAYNTELTFDRPGPWRLDITVDGEEMSGETQLVVDVAERVAVPEIGTIAPLSRTKTLSSVSRIQELTSDFTPDPDLYQLTIAEAVIGAKPVVIVFATPAFCSSPTCGPQVDTVSELKDRHKGEANFIHVEIYDNPDEVQGDLSRAVVTPVVDEWGLSTIPDWSNESWTFLIGSDGRIVQRYEGFVTLEEMSEALSTVLAKS